MMGTTPPMFWVRVGQCFSTDLFAYTRQNTLPVNKMSVLVKLRATCILYYLTNEQQNCMKI